MTPPLPPPASGNGSPIASPFGATSSAAFEPVSGESGDSRVTEYPTTRSSGPSSHRGAAATVRPIGQRRLSRLAEGLSPRDYDVLRVIEEHRFLSSAQVQRFAFQGHASEVTAARTARRVLGRLERTGLLRSLPRRQGGPLAGSTPTVWQLSPAGARLLHPGSSHRVNLPTTRHLAHCLAVADAHLALRSYRPAMPDDDSRLEVTVDVERAARRTYTGLGGETLVVRPDLYAVLSGHDDQGAYQDRWFIEVDLGTESLPTLLGKCTQYETFRASGIEQAKTGSFPLVLWLFSDPARIESLRRRVAASGRLTPALYRFASLEAGNIHRVLASLALEINGDDQ